MNTPDFELIASRLAIAEPIEIFITPERAFTLVALLQLCLRHPGMGAVPNAAETAHSMAINLIARLSAIDPAIAEALNQGWDTSLDCTPQEFDAMQQQQRVVVHNCYTLHEVNEDGSQSEHPLLSLGERPQDWGDPRWHYHRCKVEFESNGNYYVNHCHVWQGVERSSYEAFKTIASALFMAAYPGQPWQLCGREFLEEEDFWLDEWGKRPPLYQPNGNVDYDPVVLWDEEDGSIRDSQLRQICEDMFGDSDRS
ncbi:MAG: hypothetical protein KME11_05230 [Timaviella obliquedivisa GSE-PSE-MK23-08B]|jgi:hypothetical protein|nr:hypothetical protein [Timaviella obliquedivisa GSE-PSE-MK23-08B]